MSSKAEKLFIKKQRCYYCGGEQHPTLEMRRECWTRFTERVMAARRNRRAIEKEINEDLQDVDFSL